MGAKLLADEAAIANARAAIQVHGGMGYTWEVPLHLHLKRARVLATTFGATAELSLAISRSPEATPTVPCDGRAHHDRHHPEPCRRGARRPRGTGRLRHAAANQSQSTLYVADWEKESGPVELARIARVADEAGFFYLGVCDHTAIPGRLADAMGTIWYDTTATLGWLAAVTTCTHLSPTC